MKQSKKLLSIFLAMLMLLGSFSVIASAAKEEMSKSTLVYDSIDNAALTAEQVADIVLDMVDDMLKDIDMSDISKYTKLIGLELDLSSVNGAFKSLYGAQDILKNGALGIVKLGGDVEKLDVTAFKDVTREGKGDIYCIVTLLKFLAQNFGEGANIQKVVLGIGQDAKDNQFGVGELLWKGEVSVVFTSISLGFSVKSIVEDKSLLGLGWSVKDILANLPGFLKTLIFDMVMYGSYPYSKDGVNKEYSEVSGDFADVTLDGMVDIILKNFLTTPQDYKYVNDVKVWDESSYILTQAKFDALGDVSLANNSIFDFIDKVLPIAYEDFGVAVLNNDLKKVFMEAMGADFVVLDPVKDKAEIAEITDASTGYIDPNGTKSAEVKNYFVNAQMWKVGDTWYFRDYVTRDVLDANGNPVMENGEVKTAKQHRYQRVEAYDVDELFYIFNWDYKFDKTTLNFKDMLNKTKGYGSIIGSLNHILHVILEQAINPAYLSAKGTSVDKLWKDGTNNEFNENVVSTAKFVIENFAFQFFGRNEAYVDPNTLQANAALKTELAKCTTIESLVAYIGLPLLADVLPQLVYDVSLFTPGLEIEQTAALLVREFLSDLTPQINYDDQIFADPSLANGRAFKTHTSEEWMNIVLNMGLDLAMTYLDNITNINVTADGLRNLHAIADEKKVQSWQVVLEEIVDWAVLYIGNGDVSALNGLTPNALKAIRCVGADGKTADAKNYKGNAFATLTTALNALLPLGFLSADVNTANNELDVEKLFNKFKTFIVSLDLEVLLGLFGRNENTNNIFTTDNVLAQVLGLVNKILSIVWGRNVIENTTSLQGLVSNQNIASLLVNIIDGLYDRGDQLLRSLLPTVAQFVSDWGGEQTFRVPSIDIDSTMTFTEGSGSGTFAVINGSKRLWRGYVAKDGSRAQDEQYKLVLDGVNAYNLDGTKSSYLTVSGGNGTYDFGKSATVNYSVANLPNEGAMARVEITYKVIGADGSTPLSSESLTTSKYVWLNKFAGDERSITYDTEENNNCRARAYAHFYVDSSNSDALKANVESIVANNSTKTKDKELTIGVKVGTAVVAGITYPATYGKVKGQFNTDYKFTVSDEAALKEFAKTSGAVAEWKVTGSAGDTKLKFENKSVKMTFYDGAALNELRDLVDRELDMVRRADDYDTSSEAWKNYNAALIAATRGARQNFNVNSAVWNFAELRDTLKAAAEVVDTARKVDSFTSAKIDALESTVKSVEGTLAGKDYRTYALYRWNRFQDSYKSAKNIIELDRRFALGLETMNFNYSGLTVNEVNQLLALPNNGTYADFVRSTFTAMTEDEALNAKNEYNNIKRDVINIEPIDLANISDLMLKNCDRLVARDDGVKNDYLLKEITSAGTLNEADYTPMSWAVFETALDNANIAKSSDSQDTIFTAKYQLQVARNGLVAKGDEADYDELKAVIAQANAALANASSYENYETSPADFGAVIAALGYEVTDANGNVINLFPGSAIDVEDIPYGTHDQDEIDDAADELKRALAKLKFKNLNTGSVGVENKEFGTGEFDETTNAEITESVLVRNVAKEQKATQVKDLVKALGDDAVVSLDGTYSAEKDTDMFVGTGSTITVYKNQGGVNVPVATIKVVVNGDVNGDGVIDVLDCASVELASHGLVEYSGVYGLAADIATATAGITAEDLQAVVGLALNK